jgi:hypothetical protein
VPVSQVSDPRAAPASAHPGRLGRGPAGDHAALQLVATSLCEDGGGDVDNRLNLHVATRAWQVLWGSPGGAP